MLVGGLLGLAAGGALINCERRRSSSWSLPSRRRCSRPDRDPPDPDGASPPVGARAREDPRRVRCEPRWATRVRARCSLAQILWVAAYVALPVFFVLYADRVLDLGAGASAGMLAGFGILTGAAMIVAGRARPERVFPLLLLGAALLGGGLVAAAPASSVAAAAVPFACCGRRRGSRHGARLPVLRPVRSARRRGQLQRALLLGASDRGRGRRPARRRC